MKNVCLELFLGKYAQRMPTNACTFLKIISINLIYNHYDKKVNEATIIPSKVLLIKSNFIQISSTSLVVNKQF
jgi:hypothetical protein